MSDISGAKILVKNDY